MIFKKGDENWRIPVVEIPKNSQFLCRIVIPIRSFYSLVALFNLIPSGVRGSWIKLWHHIFGVFTPSSAPPRSPHHKSIYLGISEESTKKWDICYISPGFKRWMVRHFFWEQKEVLFNVTRSRSSQANMSTHCRLFFPQEKKNGNQFCTINDGTSTPPDRK